MTKIALRAYNREIETLIDQGHIEEAIAHCMHIIKSFPKHLETYRLMGKAYLEAHRYAEAADIFQRVLLAVPDDFVSHLGMSIISDEQQDLNRSIWHMERAFEVNSTNGGIQSELRHLYGRRDGLEPVRIHLTRGALAQNYVKSGEYQQALTEIKSILAEDPSRTDMKTLQARAYFRSGLKNEAIEACTELLKLYPYSLDGNRILVEVLPGTAMAQSIDQYQRRIRSLDPYAGAVTGSVFDTVAVPDDAVMVEKLDWESGQQPRQATPLTAPAAPASAQPAEDIPDWMKQAGWGASSGEPEPEASEPIEEAAPGEAAGDLAAAEIPAWLQAMAPTSPEGEAQPPAAGEPVESEAADFDWLASLGAPAASTETPAGSSPQAPEAPAGESGGETLEALPSAAEETPAQAEPAADLPAWLSNFDSSSAPVEQSSADLPDWLNSLGAPLGAAAVGAAAGEELPDWMKDLVGGPSTAETPAAAETGAAAPLEDWLDSVEQPASTTEAAPAAGQEQPLERLESAVEPPAAPLATPEEAPAQTVEPAASTAPTAAQPPAEFPAAAAEPPTEPLPGVQPADQAPGAEIPPAELAAGAVAALGMAAAETPSEPGQLEGFDWLDNLIGGQAEIPAEPAPQDEANQWFESLIQGQDQAATAPTAESVSETPPAPPVAEQPDAELSDQLAWLNSPAAGSAQVEPPTEPLPAVQSAAEPELQAPPAEPVPEISTTATTAEPPLSALVTGPGTTSAEQDDALAWLESLAQKQGAKPEELLTSPAERSETAPAWVTDQSSVETSPAETAPAAEEPAVELPAAGETIAAEIPAAELPGAVEPQALPTETTPAAAEAPSAEVPPAELPSALEQLAETKPTRVIKLPTVPQPLEQPASFTQEPTPAAPAEPTQPQPDLKDLGLAAAGIAAAGIAAEAFKPGPQTPPAETTPSAAELPAAEEPVAELPSAPELELQAPPAETIPSPAELPAAEEPAAELPAAPELELQAPPAAAASTGAAPAEPPLSALVTGPGTTAAEQDDALAWLESLAQKQGAKPEELLTAPSERSATAPAWVTGQPAGETPPAETAPAAEEPSAEMPAVEQPAAEAPVVLETPPAETAPLAAQPSAEIPAAEQPAAEEPPSWLEELTPAAPAEPTPAEPLPHPDLQELGLAAAGVAAAGLTAASASDEDFDWLGDLSKPAEPAAQSEPLAETPASVPQVAASLPDAPEVSLDWLGLPSRQAAPETVQPSTEPEKTPDWFATLEEPEASKTSLPMPWEQPAVPAATEAVAPEFTTPPEAAAPVNLPPLPWEAAPSTTSTTEPTGVKSAEDAAWLAGLGKEGETPAIEPLPWEAEEAPAAPAPEKTGSDAAWLASLGQESEAPSIEPLPWESEAVLAEPASTKAEADAAWLASLGEETAAQPVELPPWEAASAPGEPAMGKPGEDAAWLAETGDEAEPLSVEPLPWEALAAPTESGETGLTERMPWESEPETGQTPAQPEPASSDLSDWLKSLDETQDESRPAETAQPWASKFSTPAQPQVSAEEELPDWLRDTPLEDEQQPTETAQSPAPLPATPSAELEKPAPVPPMPAPPIEVPQAAAPVPSMPAPAVEPPQASVPAVTAVPQYPADRDVPGLQRARALLAQGNLDGSMSEYSRLIRKGKSLDEIVHDLKEAVDHHPVDVIIWQTLGDAHFRSNRLQEALDAYGKAEGLLR